MLALNPVAPERFLEGTGGNKCEQVARKYLEKLLDRFGDRIKTVRWGDKHVACGVKGTLGYIEWYTDDTVLVHVPYPDTPYRLETFLHELGHIWLDHNPDKSCNGKKSRCRPGNREEYEAENFALTAMRKEGIEIDACTLSDAQDNVVDKLFRDAEAGRPVSRDAIKFVEINDRLQTHGGWESFLEAVEDRDMPVINPKGYWTERELEKKIARLEEEQERLGDEMIRQGRGRETLRETAEKHDALSERQMAVYHQLQKLRRTRDEYFSRNPATPEQYRLAQAVMHGTARFPTRMTKEAARELIEDTPRYLRSSYMRNPAEESAEVYEEFHGRPSEHVTEVSETEHYHSHLPELGILKGLKFRTVDGERDVTLDFDCEDCDHEQSGNLWGFGGGGKKVSGSSRLMREAFEAGYNGTGGYRGTQEFKDWLEHAAGDQDLTRSFKKSLQREYMRGMKNWQKEGEVAAELGKKRGKGSAAAARGTQYATAVARRNPDFEAYWEDRGKRAAAHGGTIEDAWHRRVSRQEKRELEDSGNFQRAATAFREGWLKEFHGHNPRKGPIARASEFAGSMAHGAVAGVDSMFTGNPAGDKYFFTIYVDGKPVGEVKSTSHLKAIEAWRRKHPGTSKYGISASGDLNRPVRTGNPADDDGPVILCSNERMNQLYLVGGDQAVDLFELKINANHDSVVLGQCWAISYSTEKEFDDFKQIEYIHTFAPDKLQRRMRGNEDLWEQAKPPYQEAFENGDLPTLRYDVLNQTLHFDGGSYFVTDKGIED